MQAKDRLLKNVFIFSIGNLGSRFLVFLLVPLFSRYLSTSDVGFYDMVVVTVSLIIPIANIQLSESIFRWLIDAKDKDFKKIISSSLIVLFFTILVVLFLFYIGSLFYSLKYRWLIGGYFLVLAINPFFLAIARGMKMNKLYALSGIVNSFILILANWILLTFFSLKIDALFIANIIACSISIIILFFGTKVYKHFSIKYFSKSLILDFISYSVPLIPNAISWWLIGSVNRYIILYFLGQSNNGIYALASRLAMALYAMNAIFNLAWNESAITEFDKGHRDRFYTDIFNKYFILEITLVIILIPISKIFVLYFVGESFRESWKYIPVLLIGVAFSAFSSFFATGYLSAKKTRGAFLTTLFGAIINIIIALYLVPLLGLQGATIGLMCGFIVTFLLRVKQTKKYFSISFDFKKNLPPFFICLSSLFLVFWVDNLYGLIVFVIISIIPFYILNKFLLRSIITKLTGRLRRV